MHSLFHIEKAVRANFLIDPNGTSVLDTLEARPKDSKSVARTIFIAMAAINGHRVVDVCDYLNCTLPEYSKKLQLYHESMKIGELKGRIEYDWPASLDVHLRIYRKSILVTNYLNNLTRKSIINL